MLYKAEKWNNHNKTKKGKWKTENGIIRKSYALALKLTQGHNIDKHANGRRETD